jgi:hypothetical protein
MRRPSLAIFAAALAAFALAGCTPGGGAPAGGGSPEPAPSASDTTAPTPTTEPTPEPVARADFGFTYFRDANLGDTWAQMSAELGRTIAPLAECTGSYGLVEDGGVSGTTTVLVDSEILPDGATLFYTYVTTADMIGPYPRNAEGVGVGSTRAEVLAAYPGAVVDVVTPHFEESVTRILVNDPDSDSQYAFGISGYHGANTVDQLQWGLGGAGGVWQHFCEGS